MIWALLILAALIVLPVLSERRRHVMDDTARGSAPGSFAELPQGVTHYQWHGPAHGPVVVCIHGLTTPSFVWKGLTPGLVGQGFRVLTYDLYGRGYSDRPRGIQDRAFFLRQLDDLLAHQKVSQDITLMGYSMGGVIAACHAAAHVEQTRQLILLAPAGMGGTPGKLGRFIIRTPVIGDWLMLALYPLQFYRGLWAERAMPKSVPDIAARQRGELHFRGFVAAVLASLRGLLSQTMAEEHRQVHRAGVPVLAVWGRQDRVIPLSSVGALAEWSRDAQQHMIDDAGHGLPYTHADQVGAILRDGMIGAAMPQP